MHRTSEVQHRAAEDTLTEEGVPSLLGAGRYEVFEEIGDGAMGRVWRGHDPLIGRPAAVKTVKAEYLTRETREEYLQRFRREARAAGQLSHPNIVSLYDVGEDFFVMELLEGVTLAELIRRRGGLPLAEVLDAAARQQARAPGGRWSSLWTAGAMTLGVLAAGLLGVARVPPPAVAGAAGGLAIESEPSGALVSLDGRGAGRSPVVLSGLTQGPHRLRVEREGFAPAELLVHVTPGMGLVPLRFALSGVTAPLEVRTQDGVIVRIDGREVGRTPLGPVHVSAGVHELRLERRGLIPQRHALLARAGEPLTVTARLLPVPAEVAESLPAPTPIEAEPPPLPPESAPPVEPPRPVRSEPARYPEAARRLQMAGSVLVEATVLEDGHVGDVLILESAGSLLDEAVVAAVRRWVFSPARQGGRPVRSTWRYRQTFRPR